MSVPKSQIQLEKGSAIDLPRYWDELVAEAIKAKERAYCKLFLLAIVMYIGFCTWVGQSHLILCEYHALHEVLKKL